MRVIIAGSREFNNYPLLKEVMDEYTRHLKPSEIAVISGTARGADRLGERWAKERNVAVERHPADWKTHGKNAGYLRNQQMAAVASHAVVFWDGKSRGSKHMIDVARESGLVTHVVAYNKVVVTRGQIGKAEGLNVTVKSGDRLGRKFAPTWKMVMGYKRKEIPAAEYAQQYQDILDNIHVETYRELFRRGKRDGVLCLLCYCRDGNFCHTYLLIKHLVTRFGAGFELHPDLIEFMEGWQWASL